MPRSHSRYATPENLHQPRTGGSAGRWAIGLALAGAAAAVVLPYLRRREEDAEGGYPITLTTTIDRSAQEIHDFWMRFQLFDQFIPHVKSVIKVDDTLSDWTVEGPAGADIHFTSAITGQVPGESISWHVTDPVARHEGQVTFNETSRGTIVLLELRLDPPMGPLGALFAELLGKPVRKDPATLARQALAQLKQLLETGGVISPEPDAAVTGTPPHAGNGATTDAQPWSEARDSSGERVHTSPAGA